MSFPIIFVTAWRDDISLNSFRTQAFRALYSTSNLVDVYLSVLKCMHSIVCNFYFIVFIYMFIFYLSFPVIGGSSAVGIGQ